MRLSGVYFSCSRCGAKFEYDISTPIPAGYFVQREAEALAEGWRQYSLKGEFATDSRYWLCPAHADQPYLNSVDV